MKCKLSRCQQLQTRTEAKSLRTLCSVRNLVVHTTLSRTSGLDGDVPLPSCEKVRDGDENVTGGTPKVLDDVVLSPLVSYSNLVDRVDVFDKL